MNEGGWLGIAALGISALFAWLNKRDSLRHDSENAALKAQNATQAVQIADNANDLKKCEEKHEDTQGKLDKCEQKHGSTEERLAAVETKIAQIIAPPKT